MSTHEHTPTVSTSAVQNTGGRSGPQGLEEPTPDEVLRELCDKNYHQLLPLIAEKMQKEKEQQDKLNAVKARLLYSNEIEKNQRNHEESHYSESKTPTARTEPKRRHGNSRSQSPSPVANVFKRLKQNRPPSPRPMPRKEGGVFNSIQGKLSPTDKTHQGSGGDTSYQAKRWRIHGGLYGKIQSKNPGCGRSAGMHEDLRIHARYNPPELIKHLYEKIPRSMDEMYMVTTSFLQGEVAAFSHSRKKAPAPWKQPEGGKKLNFKKGFKNKQRSDRKPDRRELGTPDVRGRRSVLRSSIRTLLRQAPARNKMQIDPATNVLMRQNGHKKDPCRTIHNTRNVKIPGKRRNGVRGEDILAIHPEYPEQTIAIGSTLTEKGRKELCALLRQNLDIFAWKPADMTGVPWHMAEHHLNVREGCPPVRQKKRGKAPERNKAIQEEVEKLVNEGIMKEVHYHSWLSNPVLDGYPLPEIDWKVESLCGYPFKCFLDAYKGYHQIKMAEKDEEKIAFITSQGIFCYTKMPFGLKNAEVNGSYIAKESGMVQYLEKVKTLASNFKEFSIKQVPRSKNKKADALSKIASTSFAHLSKQVLMEELKKKSIHEKEVLAIVDEEGKTWMTPIYEYLTKEILPEDKKKARVVRRKASRYTMINETLYKKSFLGPWLRFGLPGEIVSDMDAVRDNHSKTGANTCIRLSVFALRKAPKQMAWSKEQTGVWEKESKLDWTKEARIG
ncbi:reverse transcriptase domain-containing protein [Tanacetum coccineum]